MLPRLVPFGGETAEENIRLKKPTIQNTQLETRRYSHRGANLPPHVRFTRERNPCIPKMLQRMVVSASKLKLPSCHTLFLPPFLPGQGVRVNTPQSLISPGTQPLGNRFLKLSHIEEMPTVAESPEAMPAVP